MTKHNFKLSLHQALTLTRRVAAEPTLLDRLEDIRHSVLPQLVIRKQVAVVWPATPQSDPCTSNYQIFSRSYQTQSLQRDPSRTAPPDV